jgi:hypothetical protein
MTGEGLAETGCLVEGDLGLGLLMRCSSRLAAGQQYCAAGKSDGSKSGCLFADDHSSKRFPPGAPSWKTHSTSRPVAIGIENQGVSCQRMASVCPIKSGRQPAITLVAVRVIEPCGDLRLGQRHLRGQTSRPRRSKMRQRGWLRSHDEQAEDEHRQRRCQPVPRGRPQRRLVRRVCPGILRRGRRAKQPCLKTGRWSARRPGSALSLQPIRVVHKHFLAGSV